MIFESLGPIFSPDLIKKPIQSELKINSNIHNLIERCGDETLAPEERGNSWGNALAQSTGKRWVQIRIHQNLIPNEYHEPTIRRSPAIDDRVMESFSPTLKEMVDKSQIDSEAAFATLEYFLRTDQHQLTEDQIRVIGSWFPPRGGQSFQEYKRLIDRAHQEDSLPGKESFESWVIRREICDMLEIVDHIKSSYLQNISSKTISYIDLMRVSAGVLKKTHLLSTPEGVAECNQQDELILSGQEVDFARNLTQEALRRLTLRPDIYLKMMLSSSQRDFSRDMDKVFRLSENCEIVGLENIPKVGPLIVAFSHMSQWKDPHVAPNWEMLQMIGTLQNHRINSSIALAAWVGHFRMVGGESLGPKSGEFINTILEKLSRVYNINVIDVSKSAPRFDGFFKESIRAIRGEQTYLISPEGAPAQEVLRSKPGVGGLARMTGAPVVGVAFREGKLLNGTFKHQVIFTQPRMYPRQQNYNLTDRQKDQIFSDRVMKSIAEQLPEEQRGIYR